MSSINNISSNLAGKKLKRQIGLGILGVTVAALILSAVGPAATQTAQAAESVSFPQTGFSLSDEHRFLSYWNAHGGLAQFGYPITAEILEMNPSDHKVYIVQWFERNRFEYHPEYGGTQYEVLLGLLGRQLTIGREGEAPFKGVTFPRTPGTVYFDLTEHTLSGRFKDYWETHGGLPIFGYPITQEFQELNPSDGKLYTVQWFERNRFEYHPEYAGTPSEVLLGLLGNQITGGFGYPDAPAASVAVKLSVPDKYKSGPFAQEHTMTLPPGFKLSVFISGLEDPRVMALAPNGDIFVTERRQNKAGVGAVKIITDRNRDGIADEAIIYADNLSPYPHGLAFYANYLYIALETKIVRFPYQSGDLSPRGPMETVINDLPAGQAGVLSGHQTRTIAFGREGKLYVSIGSSCDNCIETNPYRASIWQFNPDGNGGKPFATGLRNAVALGFDPKTDLLWTAVNGRNSLGDNFPPEQLTPLRPGGNYGWPYCVGTFPPEPDPQFGAGKADFCANQVDRALLTLQPHSAPLGLTFYNATQFPEVYRGGLFVVQHGSFPGERSSVYGDGLRFVSTRPGKLQKGVQEFATGWITADKKGYWGRPVAPMVGADGALYITDDYAGAIYRLSYQ